ncbi:MAG: doubled protein [Bacillales bacterium]|jgi:predicted CXXCH cytochrome family protein|nr:doubled protein [Bacillales bacterium]
MKKAKYGFTTLVVLLMISLFASTAFAAVASKVTSVVAKRTTGTEMKLSWNDAKVDGDKYQVTVKLASDNSVVAGYPVETASQTVKSVTLTGLAPTTAYYAEVVTIDLADGNSAAVKTATFKTGDVSYNKEVLPIGAPGTNAADNTLENANGTGSTGIIPSDSIVKGVEGHRTHGAYQNNTNSCASCHQTHTGATAKLLFKSSDYDTCIACHDGTMGYYNVFETDPTQNIGSGTFGGTHAGNMSVHLSDGTVQIGAAPGAATALGGNWSADFSCVSCHDPHGSYSDRLLANDPNGMAEVPFVTDVSKKLYYGYLHNLTLPVPAVTPDTADAKPTGSAKRELGNDVKVTRVKVTAADIAVAGNYYKTGLKENDWILQVWKYSLTKAAWIPAQFNTHYVDDAHGIELYENLAKTDNYNWKDNTSPDSVTGGQIAATMNGRVWKQRDNNRGNEKVNVAGGYFILGAKGFIKFPSETEIDKIMAVDGISIVNKVTIPADPDVSLGQVNGLDVRPTDFSQLVGQGAAIPYNEFCATCHLDYLGFDKVKYNTNPDGTYEGIGSENQYYHHSITNSYACARCHFAHGTDVTFMKDALGRSVTEVAVADFGGSTAIEMASATAWMLDVNPSSALKRYTNMSVCYGCHTSSHAEPMVGAGQMTSSTPYGFNPDGGGQYFGDIVNGALYDAKTNKWYTDLDKDGNLTWDHDANSGTKEVSDPTEVNAGNEYTFGSNR